MADADDFLDGCDLEIDDPDDDLTASLRTLFPQGADSDVSADEWADVFGVKIDG